MAATSVALLLTIVFQAGSGPEARAVEYLSKEVPRWSVENRCFSCHNNGDGGRALYIAHRQGYAVSADSLGDTSDWLAKPSAWDADDGQAGFSDKKLAYIQFGATLADALESGRISNREPLLEAARSIVSYQDADGSWKVDVDSSAGSPATYGPALATFMARQTLERTGDPAFASAIAKSDGWLRQVRVNSVVNAAAAVLALHDRSDSVSVAKVEEALRYITGAQAADGAWGPFPNSPAEPFDTAIALLALNAVRDRLGIEPRIRSGRSFLISIQLSDGGWTETTRPGGGTSYAQHVSTSGWAALALIETRRTD